MGGHDILDEDLVVSDTNATEPLTVTFSDLHNELSGVLSLPSGEVASDYVLVIYPRSASLRIRESRRIRAVHADDGGKFEFIDLPAGDYLLAAVTDVLAGEWQVPRFLEGLERYSVAVTIADGQTKHQDVRIQRR